MDFRASHAMAHAMVRRSWLLLLCLIAASLVATTTTHAREWTGETTLECSGALHSEGDADQSQGDGDKAMPHHHGSCHGPAAAVPVTMALDHAGDTRSGYIGRSVAALPSRVLDPALRPPQA